eukprot:6600071-Pyramimonas_sp.AAC.1
MGMSEQGPQHGAAEPAGLSGCRQDRAPASFAAHPAQGVAPARVAHRARGPAVIDPSCSAAAM